MSPSTPVHEDKRSPMLALGILSISFLMSVSNAVSGTIPLMEKYFSDVSRANVELLIVISTGGVLLGTVISGLVSNLLGKKVHGYCWAIHFTRFWDHSCLHL